MQHLPHDHGSDHEKILSCAPSGEEFASAAELLALLGDGSRARLFWLLCHCEECVLNLAAMMGMSSPALSHHLSKLKAAGLIVSRREGKEVYYKAADVPEAKLLHGFLEELLSRPCPREA